jgi:hypothetical protein
MTARKLAATGAVAGASLLFAAGAWAAQQGSATSANAGAAVPETEAVLSAPAQTKRWFFPTRPDETQPAQASRSSERAGTTKPVKVYWYLSGR